MPAHPDKPKEDRVKETITILMKLKEIGISDTEPGFALIKQHMSKWVHDGEAATYTVEFARYGRRADLTLPRRADRAATLNLRAPK